MNAVQAKSKPIQKRGSPPAHTSQRAGGGWRGLAGVQMAELSTGQSMGAFYSAGPAYSLVGGGGMASRGGGSSGGSRPGSGASGTAQVQQQAEETIQPQMVQMWDCTDLTEPTCVEIQTKEAPAEEEPAPEEQTQEKCAECEAEEAAQEEPLQEKCAECEAEEAAQEEQTQEKCAECEAEEAAQEEPVQEKCAECAAEDAAEEERVQQAGTQSRDPQMIQREARAGLKGASQPLPHGEQIQAAFGRHDVSQVRTSIGGDARTSNRRMGALAYTSGNRIGFRDSPSLHLAAHEATHVVQQREGLSLPGNVGRPGDPWERHADQVADTVSAGRSAEGLLDQVAPPARSASAAGAGVAGDAPATSAAPVQHQITSRAARLFEPAPAAVAIPSPRAEAKGKVPAAGAGKSKQGNKGEEGSALEAAKAGENEKPMEGVPEASRAPGGGGGATPAARAPASSTAGGSSPAAGAPASSTVGASPSAAGAPAPAGAGTPTASTGAGPAASAPTPAPAAAGSEPAAGSATPAAAAPTQAPAQPGIGPGGKPSGPCYNVDPPPPPENAPEPTSDERGSKPEKKPQITYPAWPSEADKCESDDIVKNGRQQMPEGFGSAAAGPGGGEAPGASSLASAGPASAPASGPASAEPTGASASSPESAGSGKEAPQGAPAAGGGQMRAQSGAPSPGGGPDIPPANDMDNQITTAEGERDAAVNEYLAATEGLKSVISRSQALESGVTFPSVTGTQQKAARQSAIAQTRAFMAHAADQIAAAVGFAQEQVPGILGGAAETTKANIQGAMETEKAAISGRITQARIRAIVGARAARTHVNATYKTNAAEIELETTKAINAVNTTHTTSVNQMDKKEADGLADVNNRFAKGRTQHEAKGPEYAKQALQRGQEHAHAYEHCKTTENGWYGDDGFWDGCLTVRRAKAQQDTACKTAAGYKDIFLHTANKKGSDLIVLRRQYRCAVISGAREVNKTLDDTHAKLISGLETGRTQALQGIAEARDTSLAAIDKALAATLKSLSTQEYTQRQAVDDTGYLKQLTVERLAHASASGLGRGISAAMDSLERTLRDLRESLAKGNIPDPATLAQSLAAAEAGLGGGMGSLLGRMQQGASQAEGSITGFGAASLEALLAITTNNDQLSAQAESGFVQQMGSLKAGASKAIGQLAQDHIGKARTAMTEGTGSMKKAVAGFDKALGGIGEKVDGAIATSLQQLDKQLKDKLAELDGQITREAWKAAAKEQPAWKKVVAIVLIIVVIIAAAVISIVTLGAGASLFAMVVVGALVGAVSAGLIQILNNWSSGESWHKGVAQAMIMGAIGGAIGGGLGFAGGALAQGAAAAGAGRVAQFGIKLGFDLLSEGLTQSAGNVIYGQNFSWQGFVMAGAMSSLSHSEGAGLSGTKRVVSGAAVGLGVEYATSKISGQEFDPTRAASAAASAAVAAHMSGMGHGETEAPPIEPGTGPKGALERFRTFDPGGVGARLEKGLQGVGGRIAGGTPGGEVAAARPQVEEPAVRTGEGQGAEPGRIPPEEAGAGPKPTPTDEPGAETGRVPTEEQGVGRQPVDAETAAELAGPAKDMKEPDLIEATTIHEKVGDTDHEFRIGKDGCEVCSTGCGIVREKLDKLLEKTPPGKEREGLERLRNDVDAVSARLAKGESGAEMINELARIAAEFRELAGQDPRLGRALEEPQLARSAEPGGKAEDTTHLADLKAKVKHVETIPVEDYPNVPMKQGDKALYILRDSEFGAILKVGIAENSLDRVTQYVNAGKKLQLKLELDVAIVTPNRGKTILDIEKDLRTRLTEEGNVMPWDNTRGRLGRSDRGTPFVHPVGKDMMWDAHGNLVHKGTGAPPPPRASRAASTPEEVAALIYQGLSNKQIAAQKGVDPSTVSKWRKKWAAEINAELARIQSVDLNTTPQDGEP